MKTFTIDNNGNMAASDGARLTESEVKALRAIMNSRTDFDEAFEAGEYMEAEVQL